MADAPAQEDIEAPEQAAASPYLYEEVYQPWFVWMLILCPCLMPTVWKYHVRVTDETLSYGYSAGCASRTVDRGQIETIEKVPLIKPVFDWGGWGIRKQLPSWDTGYIPKKGPGIRVTLKLADGKEKNDTFLCDDPDTVISLLAGSE